MVDFQLNLLNYHQIFCQFYFSQFMKLIHMFMIHLRLTHRNVF